jgi:hypothetical protein
MSEFRPVAREAQRNAVCRACHESIPKGTPMISWWSYMNRGMDIHLHEECAIKLGTLAINTQTNRGQNV